MATTTTIQTVYDVERAIIPVDFSQRPSLSNSLIVCSARLGQSFRSFTRSFTLLQVVKFSVGALVGTLGLVSAWWALDLAMWTSVKDFREDCREQLQNFNMTSTPCQEVLSRPLREPPTWRGYLERAAGTLSARSAFKYAVLDDRATAHAQGGRRPPRRQLASGSVKSYRERLAIARDELFEPLPVGISSMQGNAAIMYGADEDGDSSFRFPLDETRQEAYDELCGWFEVTCPCDVWLNTTITGTIQDIKAYAIPDPGREPEAFEELLALMPPRMQSPWRQLCVYPSVEDPVAVRSRRWIEVLEDYGTALAWTFLWVSFGHQVIYWGIARKIRWKWR